MYAVIGPGKPVVLAFILCTSFFCEAQKKSAVPAWVLNRPIDEHYFIGISSARKSISKYKEAARQAALNDLSAEIQVIISGESVLDRMEVDNTIKQQFKSQVKATTHQQLEGYEMVDDWRDKKSYWVYYRLSKTDYYSAKRQKFTLALQQSQFLFDKAIEFEQKRDYYQAFINYLLANQPIQPYLTDVFDKELQSKCYNIEAASKSALINILSNIQLKAEQDSIHLTYGAALQQKVAVKAVFIDEFNNEHPVKNLPIYFSFEKGEGTISASLATTDYQGVAQTVLTGLSTPERKQIIAARLSVADLLRDYEKEVLVSQSLKREQPASEMITLSVGVTTLFIQSSENNFGSPLAVKVIEPAVKNFLKEHGFDFSDNKEAASSIIHVSANTRQGNSAQGMRISYLDLEFYIIDRVTQRQVFAKPMNDIKGVKLDYESAGHDAYKKTVIAMRQELYPELLNFYNIK